MPLPVGEQEDEHEDPDEERLGRVDVDEQRVLHPIVAEEEVVERMEDAPFDRPGMDCRDETVHRTALSKPGVGAG